ncbi:hypothetical protein Agub_g15041 [Astrephomene gubernaculifera]|uniref:RING-type domain-containing protein n=1 Tax=Astrephomene gubernaculifera TaxID=47775 RepID=A0AAD3E447_9CHLO|nr:hypothetical protein Agub_g15041 [Astrephomene gubernaculifera]
MQPAPLDGAGHPATNEAWARLLELLQNAQAARPGNAGYPAYNPGDMEDASLEAESTTSADSSPARPDSPGERRASSSHATAIPHQPLYLQQTQPRQHPQSANAHRSFAYLSQLSRRPQAVTAAATSGAIAAQPVDSEDPEASVSASAERHRLATDSSGISLSVLAEWVSDLVPFTLLLLWVLILQHTNVLLLLVLLSSSILAANADIRKTLAMRTSQPPPPSAPPSTNAAASATSADLSISSGSSNAALRGASSSSSSRILAAAASVASWFGSLFAAGSLTRQLLRVVGVTAAAVLACVTDEPRVLRVLALQRVSPDSVLDALLLVLLGDSFLRLAAMLPKLATVAWFRYRLSSIIASSNSSNNARGGSSSSSVWGRGTRLLRRWFLGGSSSSSSLAAGTSRDGAGGGCGGCCAAGGAAGSWCARLLWSGGGLWAGGGGGGGGGSSYLTAGAGSGGGGGGGSGGTARALRQQSRVLTAVERGVAAYRAVIPAPVWYGYLLHGSGLSPVPASLFCGFYLALKAPYVIAQVKLLVLALRVALRQGALYGTYVGRDGEMGSFGACPVCQDPVSCAVRLDCGHVFCEECIVEWMERDRTCPMCRANVRPAGLPACNDGASPLLPQVF